MTLAEKIAVIEEDAYLQKRILCARETNFDHATAKIVETEPSNFNKLTQSSLYNQQDDLKAESSSSFVIKDLPVNFPILCSV